MKPRYSSAPAVSARTKEQKRRRAFAFRGNVSVIEAAVGPVGCVKHPNRVLKQHRSSNRGRQVSKTSGNTPDAFENSRNRPDILPESRSPFREYERPSGRTRCTVD